MKEGSKIKEGKRGEEGRQEERKEGRQEGRKAGRQEDRRAGRKEGGTLSFLVSDGSLRLNSLLISE